MQHELLMRLNGSKRRAKFEIKNNSSSTTIELRRIILSSRIVQYRTTVGSSATRAGGNKESAEKTLISRELFMNYTSIDLCNGWTRMTYRRGSVQ